MDIWLRLWRMCIWTEHPIEVIRRMEDQMFVDVNERYRLE